MTDPRCRMLSFVYFEFFLRLGDGCAILGTDQSCGLHRITRSLESYSGRVGEFESRQLNLRLRPYAVAT
jgi:hypothetical protein